MQISELIKALQRMPGDALVVYDDTKRGLVPATRSQVTAGWMDGDEFINGPPTAGFPPSAAVTMAVIIS